VYLHTLSLRDFRSYGSVDIEFVDGLCALVGPNGVGKSNVLEAIGYLAMLESFRGAPNDALVKTGAQSAFVRGHIRDTDREQLIEAELRLVGQNRVLLNRQRLSRSRDLVGALRVVVFAPDDLALLKGGPSTRRNYLDQLLIGLDRRNDLVRSDFDKALRQRNALLKQTRGRLDETAQLTLEVWDSKLIESGERLAELRSELVESLGPVVAEAYADVADGGGSVTLSYEAPWQSHGLAAAISAVRPDELRRGITLVGPHRDDLFIGLADMPARTHGSQGEQRSLALALRLAAHRLVERTTGTAPVLLLDDVFSELDPKRSTALLECLPRAQTFLTTAGPLPSGVSPDQQLTVAPGSVAAQPVGSTDDGTGDDDG
jgi:DNA replication and repair protein RecF